MEKFLARPPPPESAISRNMACPQNNDRPVSEKSNVDLGFFRDNRDSTLRCHVLDLTRSMGHWKALLVFPGPTYRHHHAPFSWETPSAAGSLPIQNTQCYKMAGESRIRSRLGPFDCAMVVGRACFAGSAREHSNSRESDQTFMQVSN